MSSRMYRMLVILGFIFGAIFGYQLIKKVFVKKYLATQQNQPITVSTIKAQYQPWQPKIKASGTLRAVKGVDVTTEISGMVRTIKFTPGADVKKGDLLVKLNDDCEVAQLQSLQAAADLAKITLKRNQELFKMKAVSQAQLDSATADMKSKEAQVVAQAATVAKKTICAPFDGRLGISLVNPGQYINPGDKIATLQTLDPIYVDFYLPQQDLVQLANSQNVTIKTDAYPELNFKGKISTIDPKVNISTRNVHVEATIPNPDRLLFPGMFAEVQITTGKAEKLLTLPQTAISFNPYGEIAYVVKQDAVKGKKILNAQQVVVEVGETRGDQIVVHKGLREGDTVVTSGQLKLKNGSKVVINNAVVPEFAASPLVEDDN